MRAVAVVAALGVAASACGGAEGNDPPPASTVAGDGVRAVAVVTGLDRPVHVAVAPGEPGRLYVVGQAGVIVVVEDGRVLSEPFLDVRGEVRTSPRGEFASEEGLLSVAFAPDYERSRRLYVDYTDRWGTVTVAEYRERGGRADPASARVLLRLRKTKPRHHGGQLQFGRDGLLYASVGDDARSRLHPQRLEGGDLNGKIARLDVDDPDGRWEVVAYGLRNPWRFSFDRETDELWVGDVGENRFEEVDRLSVEPPLENLGWDRFEGHQAMVWDDGGQSEPRGPGEPTWPVAVYSHEAGCSVVGGYVYRGRAVPALAGRYVYGDFCTGAVWSLDPERPEVVRHELDLGTTLASFGEDAAGELYLVSRRGTLFALASN